MFWQHINLIHVFTFYLAAIFLLSTYRRLSQYQGVVQLAVQFPNRWPKVMKQMQDHRTIFYTWTILRPAAIAISLMLIQWVCSKLIWPTATVYVEDLYHEWWMIPFLSIFAIGMVLVDSWGILYVGKLDRVETERYLDEAEHWLTSWKTPLLNTISFGYINPRSIVDKEVKNAMIQGHDLIRQSLWWMAMQYGWRLLFGLTLWTTWAILPD